MAESKTNLAQADLDRLAELQEVREAGKGSGSLKADKQGGGVRASELSIGSQNFLNHTQFTSEEFLRLCSYRELIALMISNVDSDLLNEKLHQIYLEHSQALEHGGFLNNNAMQRSEKQAEQESMWDAQVARVIFK